MMSNASRCGASRAALSAFRLAWLLAGAAVATGQAPSAETCQANLEKLGLPQPIALIVNGSFEDGDGSPWTFQGKPPGEEPAGNVRRSSEVARTGRQALRFDSGGVPLGQKYLTARHVARGVKPGQQVKVSFWSFLQTAPHADFDPVQLTVRQYRKEALASARDMKVFNDTGEWRYGELVLGVGEDVEKMDLLFVVRNTATDRPAVLFVDDVRCETVGVVPLTVRVLTPEVMRADGVCSLDIRLDAGVLAKGACRLDALVASPDGVARRFQRAVTGPRLSWPLGLSGAGAGLADLHVVLSVNGVGPVSRVDRQVRLYDGPFGNK